MRSVDDTGRRALLVWRHHLAGAPARDVHDAVAGVLALHATDPATVFLSVLARCPEVTLQDVAEALYETPGLVRMMGMRRTLFVVPHDLAPVVHAGAAVDVAATARRTLVSQLGRLPTEPAMPADIDGWLREVEDATVAVLAGRGSATGAELSALVPSLRTAILPTTDKAYDVRRNITTQVLTVLGAQGRIVRGRPLGGWNSRRHVWQIADAGLVDGGLDPAQARARLAHRWLERFGPATLADVQWWTGWTKAATTRALQEIGVESVALDAGAGVDLPDAPVVEPIEPGVTLLPALDPTPMGWKERDWYFACDRTPLFDRNGNVGPTVWWGGEIVGGWSVRSDGRVVWRLLADRGATVAPAVKAAADRLTERLEGRALTPSFPTPLERELRGG